MRFPRFRLSKSRVVLLAATATAMLSAQASVRADVAAPLPKDQAEGIIFERQEIMTQLDKDSEALGDIIAGLQPPDKLADVAEAIARGARESRDAFAKNKVPGGRSKPEVWSNWDDFSKRMDAFVTNSQAMAEMAKAGNPTALNEITGRAMPCKDCHQLYRAPKKPAA